MYIPAERSIVSVAENKSKLLKELPDSCETFYDEFISAKNFFCEGYDLPFEKLQFKYDTLNDAGWIYGGDYKVRLINASSGIQSSLPMCMVSKFLSQKVANQEDVKLSKEEKERLEKEVARIMEDKDLTDDIKNIRLKQLSYANRYGRFINVVEELELSLFPQSQMDVLNSLVECASMSDGNMLVITSHSPYTLAILNTLIMASIVYEKGDDSVKEEVCSIVPLSYHISANDICAFSLSSNRNDYCTSIINEKTSIIAKNDLDSVSDVIMSKFNNLYRIYAKISR